MYVPMCLCTHDLLAKPLKQASSPLTHNRDHARMADTCAASTGAHRLWYAAGWVGWKILLYFGIFTFLCTQVPSQYDSLKIRHVTIFPLSHCHEHSMIGDQ